MGVHVDNGEDVLPCLEVVAAKNEELAAGLAWLGGSVLGANEDGGVARSARQVALGAGLPVSTPATTINKVCGSSLRQQ